MRPIDADALRNDCIELIRCIDAETVKEDYYDGMECGVENVMKCIDEAPTIDAEPVRHGKWIGYAGTIGNECSVCGKWIDVLQGTAEMNYCPECGARMDQ